MKQESINFCHISPTKYLETFVSGRPFHLTLAHLIEVDPEYVEFYVKEKETHECSIIMDNSAFEMYKQNREMYDSSKLIDMATKVHADYIVMSDYPGEPSQKTINKAVEMSADIKAAGFGTFFVPQSQEGDLEDYLSAYEWAADNPDIVDYVGVSILGAPLAYGVERDNKLQRYLSRYKIMMELEKRGILDRFQENGTKIHFLGMVDGPNEVELVQQWKHHIDTWDSSAASWLGLNGGEFDNSPTGRVEGKFELEVDFDYNVENTANTVKAIKNIAYIDKMCK